MPCRQFFLFSSPSRSIFSTVRCGLTTFRDFQQLKQYGMTSRHHYVLITKYTDCLVQNPINRAIAFNQSATNTIFFMFL